MSHYVKGLGTLPLSLPAFSRISFCSSAFERCTAASEDTPSREFRALSIAPSSHPSPLPLPPVLRDRRLFFFYSLHSARLSSIVILRFRRAIYFSEIGIPREIHTHGNIQCHNVQLLPVGKEQKIVYKQPCLIDDRLATSTTTNIDVGYFNVPGKCTSSYMHDF